jgi:hypothetical protein
MVYFVLAAGLIIIYFALKKKPANNSQISFKDILNEKNEIANSSNEELINQIKELNERLDELENAFLLYLPEISTSDTKEDFTEVSIPKQTVIAESEENAVKPANKVDDNNYINNQIYSLYDNGKTIEEIASFLHTGKGEISLRLGLRKQKI